MEEMLSYVFGTIRSNDASIQTIKRDMKQQSKINTRVAFLICGLAYTMLKNKKNRMQKWKSLQRKFARCKRNRKAEREKKENNQCLTF